MKTTEEIINSFEHLCFCGKENEVTFVPKNNLNISRVKKWYSQDELLSLLDDFTDENGLISSKFIKSYLHNGIVMLEEDTKQSKRVLGSFELIKGEVIFDKSDGVSDFELLGLFNAFYEKQKNSILFGDDEE